MKELIQSMRENIVFLVTCLAIFAGLVLLAWFLERFVCTSRRRARPTQYVAFVGMSAALGAILMLIEIPLFFAPSFYKLDFSELPVLICSFYFGPVSGVVCELLKVLIRLLLKGSTTAFVGEFANFVIGCSFVIPASAFYHMNKTKRMAKIGLLAGSVCMTVFGSAFNAIYLLPKFAELYGMPLDAIIAMGQAVNSGIHSVSTLVLLAVVPFNIVKGIAVSVLTFLLYKRVGHAVFRLDSRPSNGS